MKDRGYLTPDPLGLTPAPNPHTYVPNPTFEIDPLGLERGTATVRWDPEQRHATIEVQHQGKSLITEQIVSGWNGERSPNGKPTTGAVVGRVFPDGVAKTFDLPDAAAAQRAQLATINADLDKYSLRDNNCVTYCVDIPRVGGYDIPEGIRGALWLKQF
jgi:hypothetical protein